MAIVVINSNDNVISMNVPTHDLDTPEDLMSRAFNDLNDVFGFFYLEDYIDLGGGVFAVLLKSHKNDWIRLAKVEVTR